MRVTQTNNNSVSDTESTRGQKTEKSGQARSTKKGEKADKTTSTAPKGGDAVNAEISSAGKEFALAKAVASDAPDVRDEKIAELKRRIAAGKYNIDAEAVADRMVDDHLKAGIG